MTPLAIYFLIGWIAMAILMHGVRNNVPLHVIALAVSAFAILLMDQFQDAIYQREKWLVIGLLVGYAWEHRQITLLPPQLHSQKEGN